MWLIWTKVTMMIVYLQIIWDPVKGVGEMSGVCWIFATVVVALVVLLPRAHTLNPQYLFYFLLFLFNLILIVKKLEL